MGLFVGNTTPSKIFKGNTPIKSVWVGTTKVRPLTPGIFHKASLGLISMSSDGISRTTIADKNLGATQVYNYGDTLSQSNCGNFFQRGNNYGFSWTGPTQASSTQVDTTGYGPGNYYSRNIFVTRSIWNTPTNSNLRGGDTNTNESKQGPCSSGFHIPTDSERYTIRTIMYNLTSSYTGDTARMYFKIPFGYLVTTGGTVNTSIDGGWYHCANTIGQNQPGTWWLQIYSSSFYPQGDTNTNGVGAMIRPFKNTPVIPDDTRTKMF